MIEAGDVRRLSIQGLSADRAPVIAGGLAIMSAVFAELKIDRMALSPYALRHGVLFDLIGRAHHHDMREQTVEQFARRYHVDVEQAKRVEALALRLHAQLADALSDEERAAAQQRLRWAARLSEIGISIAYNGFHKHSSYIARNADMPGFSKSDQADLALLLLGQRGSLAKLKPLVATEEDWTLIAVLRLATLLNRRRAKRESPPVSIAPVTGGYLVRAPATWLDQHPLSASALESEVEQWRTVGRNVWLQRDAA